MARCCYYDPALKQIVVDGVPVDKASLETAMRKAAIDTRKLSPTTTRITINGARPRSVTGRFVMRTPDKFWQRKDVLEPSDF